MSKSPIITDESDVGDPAEWLHNPHAGEMLSTEFLQPLDLSTADLAERIEVDRATIDTVIAGERRIDAELDLRLARYFQMSPGFFLGLQDQYELLEARRELNDALDRIVPRAA